MNPRDFEPVDNTPVEMPTRLRLPQSRTDQIRAFIRQELSRSAEENGRESFADADDIEPDDEEDLPLTRYELHSLEPIAEGTDPFTNPPKAEGQPPDVPAASSEVPPSPSPGGDDGKK